MSWNKGFEKIGLLFLVVTSILVTAGIVSLAAYTSGGITFYQPSMPGQVYQQGQPLVLSVVTPLASATLVVNVYNPQGKLIYTNTFTTNSTGGFTGTLFTFTYPKFPAGQYTITVIVESTSQVSQTYTGSIYVVFKPGTVTFDITVKSNTGVPLSGATVTITNVTSHQVIATLSTNSSGMVTYTVTWIPGESVFNISASLSGYESNYTVINATEPGTYPVTLVLTKIALQVMMYAVYSSSVNTGFEEFSPTLFGASTVQGSSMTVQVQVLFATMPVSTATVLGTLQIAGTTQTITGTYTGANGIYNLTFTVPTVSAIYPVTGELAITASYSGQSETIYLYITAYPNYTAEIVQLSAEIQALNNLIKSLNSSLTQLSTEVTSLSSAVTTLQSELTTINSTLVKVNSTVATLSSEVSSLSSEVSSLTSEVNSLSSNVSTLRSDIATINSEISTLNSEVSTLSSELASNVSAINSKISGLNSTVATLKSDISSLSTVVYGAIAVGIIGLVLAVVALVMVMRKIR